ncbi:MAG: glucosyl-3-phosphoglycerate synthase [Actinobacteria bacterium]|nr:glucosyl-3-phosphoglycerate synthase [Actinomycetota bacterium]
MAAPAAWFAHLTWRWQDVDPAAVAAHRRLVGDRVTVVIPAVDEAGTIAGVIAAARQVPGLVDEVVVVDGGSTDGTQERAAAAGARVVDQRAVLPEAGPPGGKGDALWKGLAVTGGDLVMFLDADVHAPDVRYVAGLLAPLLADAQIALAKACYDRPLRVGDVVDPTGGGRVTELVARPLLAAFWPHLSGLVQPLAGEYAGRRGVLEQVPFVAGYGVEFALLIDVAARLGANAIAQVDLGTRRHTHQSLAALSAMAAEILHVAATRLRAEGRLTGEVTTLLRRPQRDRSGNLQLGETEVTVAERPPLTTFRAGCHPV